MVILRIQELAEAKGITLEELREISGISVENFQKYAGESIDVQEDSAADLRTIAKKLNVPVVELFKPVAKRGAFKLKIQEVAQSKGITLEELSERANVHPALLAFYSTQPICKNKLSEPNCEKHLNQISQALGWSPADLKIIADLPTTRLRIQELVKERDLTLDELKVMSSFPPEFIDLLETQPVDVPALLENQNETIKRDLCDLFPCSILCPCPQVIKIQ